MPSNSMDSSKAPSLDSFSGPAQRLKFKGLLFDMDGTLIDSTAAVEKHWHGVGKELGIDPAVILETSHGRRSIDVLKVINPAQANWEYIKEMEGRIPQLYGSDASEIPGARAVLLAVTSQLIPWAIVTSGTLPLVTGWMGVLALPLPSHLVVAEDVVEGKPDPSCYVMGMEKLGLLEKPEEVLVLEDSPAGIRAGKRAGCKVLAVVTSHAAEKIVEAGPDWIVRDLRSVRVVRGSEGGVELEIVDLLEVEK